MAAPHFCKKVAETLVQHLSIRTKCVIFDKFPLISNTIRANILFAGQNLPYFGTETFCAKKEELMLLSTLGAEYMQQSQRLLQRIQRLNAAVRSADGNDKIVLKRRILSLYSDAAECRRISALLMNYGKENEYEQNDLQP